MYAPIFRGLLRQGRHILLQMDLSSDCNLRCVHCYRRSRPPDLEPIGAERIPRLEREVFPFIQRLNLSTAGEPLVSKVLPEVASAAKRAGVDSVGMTTNGILLTGAASRDLLARGLDWLAVSVDASTQLTYESIRCGGDWNVLMGNLAAFGERVNGPPRRTTLALNYTLMERNADEAVEFPSLARRVGADSISFLPLTIEREEMRSWSLFYSSSRWNRLMRALRAEAARIGIPALIPDDLPEEGVPTASPSRGRKCPAAERSCIFMTSDGNCYLCPNVVSEGPLGNVFKIPFRQIWNSPRNQECRKRAIESGEVQGCDHCKLFALGEAPADEAAYVSKHLSSMEGAFAGAR